MEDPAIYFIVKLLNVVLILLAMASIVGVVYTLVWWINHWDGRCATPKWGSKHFIAFVFLAAFFTVAVETMNKFLP